MDRTELARKILERLDEITGRSESVPQERLEETVFRRLDQAGKIVSAIQKYLPKRVTDKILSNPEGVKVEGERRQVTVLFGDLSGFTSMSETMDPEQVVEVINKYFDTMVDIAERYGGHIDKFMGDALMVLFGAPVAHEDDPLRACLAAVEMLEAMDRFSAELKMDLAMSIGLNTGEVVALNVGSKGRMEYSVIGDGVNLAARLEKVATARQCVIGENTYRQVKGKIKLKKLKPVMVKGKSKPQNVYLILGRQEEDKAGGLRAGSVKLVGRMAEMEAVKQAIAAAKAGQGRVVAISGEPGIGKSRLAKELELLARDQGFRFVKGKCYSYAASAAYLPFIRQLNALFEIGERDSTDQRRERIQERLHAWDLGDYEPFLGSLLGVHYPEAEDLDPEKRKRKTFEGIWQVFDKLASKQPLALAFEDLQWGDSLSQELLEQIVDKIGDKPVLVCCDYRPELALPFIAKPYVANLFLPNLDNRQVFQMATALAGVADVSDQVLDKLVERTEGNPLFVEEVTRHLLSRRLVKREGENLVPGKRFGKMTLPATIAGVVLGRIDKLPEEHRRVLQYAAVVGKEFDREVLAGLSKAAPESIQNSLDTLEHFEGLLYGKQIEGRKIYEFNSTTTHEAAYGTLLKTRRKELHGKVGLALEKAYQESLEPHYEDLAHHYYNSAFEDKAVNYLHKAGDKARGLYANSEALDYYGKGIGVLKKAGDSRENRLESAELLGAQGAILRLIGNLDKALKNYTAAIKIANKYKELRAEWKYLLEYASILFYTGQIEKVEKTLQAVISQAEAKGDELVKAMALNNNGHVYLRSGKMQEALNSFSQSVIIYQKLKNEKESAKALGNLGRAYEILGELPNAAEHYQKALETFQNIKDLEGLAIYNNNLGLVHLMMQDIENAYNNFSSAYSIAQKIGDKKGETNSSGNIGVINAMRGDYPTALEFFQKSLTAAEEIHDPQQRMQMMNNIGCIYQIWGQFDKASEHHVESLNIALEIKDINNECDIRRNLAIELMSMGLYRPTQDHVYTAFQKATQMGDPRMQAFVKTTMGVLHHQLGENEKADKNISEALEEARNVQDPEVILAAARALVEFKIDSGDLETANEHVNRLLGFAEKTQNKREFAYGLFNLADLMYRKNEVGEMVGPLSEALTIGQELKDRMLLGRIYLLFSSRAIQTGSVREAEDYLKDAADMAQKTGSPELEWETSFHLARLHKLKGYKEDHQKELEKARAIIRMMEEGLAEELKPGFIGNTKRKAAFAQ